MQAKLEKDENAAELKRKSINQFNFSQENKENIDPAFNQAAHADFNQSAPPFMQSQAIPATSGIASKTKAQANLSKTA